MDFFYMFNKQKCFKSLAVANYLLMESNNGEKYTLTPMKMLKLVYIAHGYMLGKYDKPLLDEPVRAWKYGPVVKSLYNAIRKYRSLPIKKIDKADRWNGSFTVEEKEVMDFVMRHYSSFDAILLSSAIIKEGTPWDICSLQGTYMSNELISCFYKEIINSKTHSAL